MSEDSQDLLKLEPRELPRELAEIQSYAAVFIKSGMFPDTKSVSQGIVKIMAGKEIGLPPFASMRGINLIQGQPQLSAMIIGTLIKKDGKYDYRVRNWTNKGCTIDFYQLDSGKREKVGETSYTEEDARVAGLLGKDNWRKYPKDMFFSRALTSGARKFTPDAFNGVALYDEGEIEETGDKLLSLNSGSQPLAPALPEGPTEPAESDQDAETAAEPETATEPEISAEEAEKSARDLLEKLAPETKDRMRLLREAIGRPTLPKTDKEWIALHYSLLKESENPAEDQVTETEGKDEPNDEPAN